MKSREPTPPDTQLIGVVHEALRRDLGRSFEVLASARTQHSVNRIALADHLIWMMQFLRDHNSGVDDVLRPIVQHSKPAAGVLDRTVAEHLRIGRLISRVEHAARRYHDSDNTSVRDELRGSLERLCVVLLPQLAIEEEKVVPVVANTVTAAEWHEWEQDYCLPHASRRERRRTARWTIDCLDPERRSHVLQQVSSGPWFLILNGFTHGRPWRRDPWGPMSALPLK